MWLFNNLSKNLKKIELKEEKWSNSYPIKNPSRSYKTNGFLATESKIIINKIVFVRKGNYAQNFFKGIKKKDVLYSYHGGVMVTKNKKVLQKIIKNELKREYYKKKEKEKRNLDNVFNKRKIESLIICLKKLERW